MKHPLMVFGETYEVWHYDPIIRITDDLQHIVPPVQLVMPQFEHIQENIANPRFFKFRVTNDRWVRFDAVDSSGLFFQSSCGEYDFEIDGVVFEEWQKAPYRNNCFSIHDPPKPKVRPTPPPKKSRPFDVPGNGGWRGEITQQIIDCRPLAKAATSPSASPSWWKRKLHRLFAKQRP